MVRMGFIVKNVVLFTGEMLSPIWYSVRKQYV